MIINNILTKIYFCIPEIFWTNEQISILVQNHRLNLCSRAVNSQRLFVIKMLVWNVRIKAFWYLNKFLVIKRTIFIKLFLLKRTLKFTSRKAYNNLVWNFELSNSEQNIFAPNFKWWKRNFSIRLFGAFGDDLSVKITPKPRGMNQ